MLAVLKENPISDEIVIKEIEMPKIRSSHLLIKVKAVGICGSDLHAYHWNSDYQKRLKGCLPVVLGHEFIGIVTETGENVVSFQKGYRVVAMPGTSCGSCYCCLSGSDGLCINRQVMAVNFDGAMAEYISVPADNCFILPNSFTTKMGSLIEPITIAYSAVLKAGNLIGKDVAIFGPGPIGYFISLFVYLSGARRQMLIGLTKDQQRLKISQESIPNIRIIFNSEKDEILRNGVDVLFDVTGSKYILQAGLEVVRKKGCVISVGLISDKTQIDTNLITRKEIVLCGSHAASKNVWRELINYLENLSNEELIKFEQCITHEFPLKDAQEAFKTMQEGIGMKVLLYP